MFVVFLVGFGIKKCEVGLICFGRNVGMILIGCSYVVEVDRLFWY